MRVTFERLEREIERVFRNCGMEASDAALCARIHTQSTYDGVASHGVNRVARFVDYVRRGWVDPKAHPSLERDLGALRVYNGNLGPGILNAIFACDQAMELVDRYGVGLVGMRNTTHWMRGGTYGLYAAQKGYAALCWTNTEAVMPPWGGAECRLGNNPFVLALPNPAGKTPFLADMSVAQYSYGKLQTARLRGEMLPYPGGFDRNGILTSNPMEIEETRRVLPAGYWKGSALAFLLDVLAAALTGGESTAQLDARTRGSCGGCSQVFILVDPTRTSSAEFLEELSHRAEIYVKSGAPAPGLETVRIPGEGMGRFHQDCDANGIFVEDSIWEELLTL